MMTKLVARRMRENKLEGKRSCHELAFSLLFSLSSLLLVSYRHSIRVQFDVELGRFSPNRQ